MTRNHATQRMSGSGTSRGDVRKSRYHQLAGLLWESEVTTQCFMIGMRLMRLGI